MTQPRHRKSPEHRPPSTQYGQQTQYGPQFGQPQYGQPPVYRQPPYGPPPFYGPGPYPPPPPKRSNRNLIISIIGLLIIAGGAVAAAFLLIGNNDDKTHSAGPGGSSAMNGTPEPGRSSAFPKTGTPQRRSVAMLSCAGIEEVLIRTGAFKAGSITVSDGGTPPDTGVPVPDGAPTTRCTVSPTHRSRGGLSSHVTAIAWRGVTERAFAAQLKSAGYDSTARGDYTFWVTGGSELVTATIERQLVTFYLA